ncbi:hypothetical protein AC477_00065 [miscellaneous Crenarchaeota group-1 archaeon SG8-32-1]|uniref:Uncharacterized protein n=1 Tax=miscellaneous Crenarchaeota group-1 archaeon SG8-32-1 TaxID=1685124 RepID=A0A0M0C1V4_9ARCH|nr:MAG: hypothetical protein AC477_00065 [miscellaneous Crenarchaeota group-1 archaeon SG8-32-1]
MSTTRIVQEEMHEGRLICMVYEKRHVSKLLFNGEEKLTLKINMLVSMRESNIYERLFNTDAD